MELVTVLLKQVLIMYILIFIGYYAYKKKLITDQGSKDIGKILLNIVIPVVIISNFCVERTPEKVSELLSSAMISLICMTVSIIVSILIYHKRNRIDEFSVAFSNAGFIGIPLVQATLGSGAVFYISIMIVLINLLQWTYGIFTITDDKKYINVRQVVKNPIVISVAIGIVIFGLNIKLPSIVNSVFSIISGINTPMAMLVSGVYLAQSDILTIIKKKDVYLVSFVRLILIPLVVTAIMKLIPLGSIDLKLAILLAGSAPVGSNVAIFASQYGKDYKRGIENVCVSTLLCIASLPLIVFIAKLLLG
ncbi:MAG: AEC family transporter [Erysipelotrichaceae bacterium]|nr:AEC family transporter [Erysipelotrichaceae bacterium]